MPPLLLLLSLQEGYTPLHRAAAGGYGACVDTLLRAGAIPCTVNKRGRSSLHSAALDGGSTCVRVLLAAGVSPNIVDQARGRCSLSSPGSVEETAQQRCGICQIVGLPLCGVSRRVRDDSQRSPRPLPQSKTTPLHLAAAEGHTLIVAVLADGGADPNSQTTVRP